MKTRSYSELTTFTREYSRYGEDGVRQWKPLRAGEYLDTAKINDASVRHKIEVRIAVHVAYHEFIEQIASRLSLGNSLLCVCDKSIADDLIEWLRLKLMENKVKLERVETLPPPTKDVSENKNNRHSIGNMVGGLYDKLAQLTYQSEQAAIVVIDHLDLMTTNLDGTTIDAANDIVYWLNIYTGIPILAFADPELPLRKVIENVFVEKIVIPPFNREDLYRLLRPEEAEKFSYGELKVSDQLRLYQYVSGLSVKRLRWLMQLIDKEFPVLSEGSKNAELVYERIRKLTTAGNLQVPSVTENSIAGYEDTKIEIRKRVIFPMQYREKATNSSELARADALIPKGVILYGPPRNGKTEIAKWIATELHYPLITIRGPELKNMYLGETERAIRRIFAQARRCSPSVLLIDEIDALTPQRSEVASGADISMVSMFLTEMDGLNTDEAVLVLGTTNRLSAVDPAFMGPGRFGVLVYVDYPSEQDRLDILKLYREIFGLDDALDNDSLEYLQMATGNIPKQGGYQDKSKWSCDHLRGICQAILLEIEWCRANGQTRNVNDKNFLHQILEKISGSGRGSDIESSPKDWRG